MRSMWAVVILTAQIASAAAAPAQTPPPAASPAAAAAPPATSSATASANAPSPSAQPVTIRCHGIGDGTFATAGTEARPFDAASQAPFALGPLRTAGGPGAILLVDGALEPGFDRWLALGAQAPPGACDLDVTIAAGMPHDRFAVTGALPRTIVHDIVRGGNTVRFLELRYAEIARLGF